MTLPGERYRDPAVQWVYSPGARLGLITGEFYLWRAVWSFIPLQPLVLSTPLIVYDLEEGSNNTVILTEDTEHPGNVYLVGEKPKVTLDLATGQPTCGEPTGADASQEINLGKWPHTVHLRPDLALRFNEEPFPSCLYAVRSPGPEETAVLLIQSRALYRPYRLLHLPGKGLALVAFRGRGQKVGGYLLCIDLNQVTEPIPAESEDPP